MTSVVSVGSAGGGNPRAIIFARFSSADQDSRSIDNQVGECEKFLKTTMEWVFDGNGPEAPPSAIPPGGDK